MGNFRIKTKIFFFIITSVVITGVLGFSFVQISHNIYENRIYNETTDKLYLYSQRIEERLRIIDDLSLSIMLDVTNQSLLKAIKDTKDSYEIFSIGKELSRKLLNYQLFSYLITDLVILDVRQNPYGVGLNLSSVYEQKEQYEKVAKEYQGASVWIGEPFSHNKFISLREIRSFNGRDIESLGTLIFRINAERVIFSSTLSKNNNGTELIILSGDEVVYNNGTDIEASLLNLKQDDFEIIKNNGQRYLAASFEMNYTGWTFIHLVPYNSLFKEITLLNVILIVSYLLSLCILIVGGYLFSKSITNPMQRLLGRMADVEKGDFGLSEGDISKTQDEIGILNLSFEKMVSKVSVLIRENYISKLMIKDANYERLKAQFNPHFLYNTLESINWLAKLKGQSQISKMVKSLGDLVRNTINSDEFVTIEEELKILDSYLYIQKIRFEERLIIDINIEESLKLFYIPSFILQPIVENSIKYGVEHTGQICEIYIEGKRIPNRLVFKIKDNGPGMNSDYLANYSERHPESKGTGLGLKGIHDRLQILFGNSYGIEIQSEIGKGTEILISIPYIDNLITFNEKRKIRE